MMVDPVKQPGDSGSAPAQPDSVALPEAEVFDEKLMTALEDVQRLLHAEFGGSDLVHDAAYSAVRTVLRRYRAGCWELTPLSSSLSDLLLAFAVKRLRELRAQNLLPLLTDAADPSSIREKDLDDQENWKLIQNRLHLELRYLRKRMDPFLENPLHKAVFLRLFESEYGGRRYNQEEIARLCHCSVSTVGRVKQMFDQIWREMVEASKDKIWQWRSQLDS